MAGPGVGLFECVPEGAEGLLCVLDRAGAEGAREIRHLIGDQIGEGGVESGDGGFVEGDHGVAEGDDEEELGEAEDALPVVAGAEHPADAVPGEEDDGEGAEETGAEGDEGRLVGGEQGGDGLLDGADGVVAGGWGHGRSLRCPVAVSSCGCASASAAPAPAGQGNVGDITEAADGASAWRGQCRASDNGGLAAGSRPFHVVTRVSAARARVRIPNGIR